MDAVFERAFLCYGTRTYDVTPNETLPFPAKFDLSAPEECGRKIAAILSNASGGHRLCDVRVVVTEGCGVIVNTSGGLVRYRNPLAPTKLTVDEALALKRTIIGLGNVVTDQYGDGWTRARWY